MENDGESFNSLFPRPQESGHSFLGHLFDSPFFTATDPANHHLISYIDQLSRILKHPNTRALLWTLKRTQFGLWSEGWYTQSLPPGRHLACRGLNSQV